jgi:hypothetical protein
MIPCVHDACSHMLSCHAISSVGTGTGLRTNVRLGEISSMLVALRILIANSDSCLFTMSIEGSSLSVWYSLHVLAHVHIT